MQQEKSNRVSPSQTQETLTFMVLRIGAIVVMCIVLIMAGPTGVVAAPVTDFWGEVFERHGLVMLVIDVESGAIMEANVAAAEFYDYPLSSLLTLNIADINALSLEELEAERLAAARQERNYFIFSHKMASGELRTVEVHSFPLTGDDRALFSIIHDITDRVTAEQQVANQNLRLLQAERVANIGHWEFDLTNNIVHASPGAMEIYGLDGADWSISQIQTIPLPEYRPVLDEALRDLVETGKPYDVEFEILRPSDNRRLSVRSVSDYDPDRNVVFGTISDITEYRDAMALVAEQSQRTTFVLVFGITALLVLVLLLSANITRRKDAQRRLERQVRAQGMIARTSTRFIDSTRETIRHKIDTMLRELAEHLESPSAWVLRPTDDPRQLDVICAWPPVSGIPIWRILGEVPEDGFQRILLSQYQLKLPEVQIETPENRQIHTYIEVVPVLLYGEIVNWLCIQGDGRPLPEEDHQLLVVIANILSDAVEKSQMEGRIRDEEERLRITLQSLGDGFIATDREGRITMMNQIAEELTGWSEADADGKALSDVFDAAHGENREPITNLVSQVMESNRVLELPPDTWLTSRTGVETPIADTAAPIRSHQGEILGVVLVFRDITSEKQREEDILFLSYYDSLTGLYNRRFFENHLERVDTERNLPLAVVMMDLNGLKLINDAFGHAQGDDLLIRAAALIRAELRTDDVVAHLGGDEFAVILPRTDAEATRGFVRRIEDALAREDNENPRVSLALGWHVKELPQQSIYDSMVHAEERMYEQKMVHGARERRKIIARIIANHYRSRARRIHAIEVATLCRRLAEALGLSAAQVRDVRIAGYFHDIGKASMDPTLLNKKQTLTENDWKVIRRHPGIGYRLLSAISQLNTVSDYVLKHHERFDGQGYPLGLEGTDIPLGARILSVVDAFDAMTHSRPYRRALTQNEASAELRKHAGTQFDPEVVAVFLALLKEDASD